MGFLSEKCTLMAYDRFIMDNCKPFDCGNPDLNEFFIRDVLLYANELLGKSYCFVLDEDQSQLVCAFTIANDSIKTYSLPNARKKKINAIIPRPKHLKSYPAVLIGRLGVNKKFQGRIGEEKSIGDQLMDFIKLWFIDKSNKTACRFLVVDAYNSLTPLNYYQRNGFISLFGSEMQELEFTNTKGGHNLKTRLLFFDLIVLTNTNDFQDGF